MSAMAKTAASESSNLPVLTGFYYTRTSHSYMGGISLLAFEAKVA